MLDASIRAMTARLAFLLSGYEPSVSLYGSVAFDDFRFGWSDIDILVLTNRPIEPALARSLVALRQDMVGETGNPYFRLFEGGMLSREAFFSGGKDTVVYWGTSGQRLKDAYALDSFAVAELLRHGRTLLGESVAPRLSYPAPQAFFADIARHCATIREHASVTGPSVASCGWLLDIARGLYTLRTGEVAAKTHAGEWALAENLAPEPDVLRRALSIRREPSRFASDPEALAFCAELGPHIQRFADVLEGELRL